MLQKLLKVCISDFNAQWKTAVNHKVIYHIEMYIQITGR
jgi:hypothetical protein